MEMEIIPRMVIGIKWKLNGLNGIRMEMEIIQRMVIGIKWKFKGKNGIRMVMEIIFEMEITLGAGSLMIQN